MTQKNCIVLNLNNYYRLRYSHVFVKASNTASLWLIHLLKYVGMVLREESPGK